MDKGLWDLGKETVNPGDLDLEELQAWIEKRSKVKKSDLADDFLKSDFQKIFVSVDGSFESKGSQNSDLPSSRLQDWGSQGLDSQGFTSQALDAHLLYHPTGHLLFEAVKLGVNVLLSPVGEADSFHAQYCIELARDLRVLFFPVVRCLDDVSLFLETDAPFVAVGDFFKFGFEENVSLLRQVVKRLPKGTTVAAALRQVPTLQECVLLRKLNCHCVFYWDDGL
jgi:hypothetical protein